MSLQDKRVVISGAASGIGFAIAELFSHHGPRLLLSDRDAEGLEHVVERCRQRGVECYGSVVDVGTPSGAQQSVDDCVRYYDGIDVLINNAGLLTQAPCEAITLEMWEEMMAVDLRSVFLSSQRALPWMRRQRWGRIINIASQLGIKGGAELCHYVAAKAGVIGFTKSLALEMAPHNVLVNAIAPGPIATPMVDGISSDWKKAKAAELPLGRFGSADEVAPAALLLASDPGGNLFVGQTLGPNSGDVMP
ncbi:SDR family NAD(P)-dependent oxidoreductase [Lonsdalea quercina]|uniref:SDR family NAD(P)-dependent oxidoreductase n=1 Tax=Lonsdalea quercina TaxID=71657 RepID=UPI003976CB5F